MDAGDAKGAPPVVTATATKTARIKAKVVATVRSILGSCEGRFKRIAICKSLLYNVIK